MANTADTSTSPPEEAWEARFRASSIILSAIAPLDPGRGLVSTKGAELAIGQTRRIIEFARSVVGSRGKM